MNQHDHTHLLQELKRRFAQHPHRHAGVVWADVQSSIEASPAALRALHAMEHSGGEPDVVGAREAGEGWLFFDCSAESPAGRRSFCYDGQALESRKDNKPTHSALGAAAAMGISLLTEAQYRQLQSFGEFDLKTSSWVATPAEVRALGGALFCDRRYGRVFTYHNGAQSYYAARDFRGVLTVP